ncbi:hypothetical protein [Ranid herpesvirus 3]|uniref:Uncharacterized protein n=1 Tax=Ranid herpesvirus 3 TaxID=1987509 RepID=A0A1X9T5D2_9VIRU|nr:hypothetical protein [Ranid herpesvirus 3]ARR28912.1 hypothetical protein [Ranid herpesvirus 3]
MRGWAIHGPFFMSGTLSSKIIGIGSVYPVRMAGIRMNVSPFSCKSVAYRRSSRAGCDGAGSILLMRGSFIALATTSVDQSTSITMSFESAPAVE